ncbi:HtpA [Salmonella phage 19]|nr:HtpA [Salmonella phage 19]
MYGAVCENSDSVVVMGQQAPTCRSSCHAILPGLWHDGIDHTDWFDCAVSPGREWSIEVKHIGLAGFRDQR